MDIAEKMKKIRIFHVEDYKIMRDGIRLLLEKDTQMEVIGEADNSEKLMAALENTPVDVLILDIYLDRMQNVDTSNGFEICQLVHGKYPDIGILIHSAYDDGDTIARLLRTGARGFVSKKSGFEELRQAVHAISQGKIFICQDTKDRLKNLNDFLLGLENHLKATDDLFSHREREVLSLIAEGLSSKEIADRLTITERTVESHRKNMVEKGKVKNTAELIAFASSLGLLKK